MNEQELRVRFEPDGVETTAATGEILLKVAQRVGVYVNNLCGGRGVCGKCRVRVKPLSNPSAAVETVFACKYHVTENLNVEVPPESRQEGQVRAGVLPDKRPVNMSRIKDARTPLARAIMLELPPPSLTDHTADFERVAHALGPHLSLPLQPNAFVLSKLSETLRASNWRIMATVARQGNYYELLDVTADTSNSRIFALAVDVGTTTIAVSLVDTASGEILGVEARYNSQIQYGADVISRIVWHEDHAQGRELQQAVVRDIQELSKLLCEKNHIKPEAILSLVCAGNTTMMHFLLGWDPRQLRREPFIAVSHDPSPIKARELGLRFHPEAILYSLPMVGSYVGADISAGILAVGLDDSPELTLFVDLGTNGEIVIGNRDWMMCCSASVGPAFEGGGLKHGLRASAGAIDTVRLSSKGRVSYSTVDDRPPLGICGSGIIDSVAELLKAGVIDRGGKFTALPHPLVRQDQEGKKEFVLASKDTTPREITITGTDIESLIRAKAAVYAGINSLLNSLSLDTNTLEKVIIAGGFGRYLNVENAFVIGLLPEIPPDKVEIAGNTSLHGCEMAACSVWAYEQSREIAKKMTYFELMTHAAYMEELVAASFLPHTHAERFPSAGRLIK